MVAWVLDSALVCSHILKIVKFYTKNFEYRFLLKNQINIRLKFPSSKKTGVEAQISLSEGAFSPIFYYFTYNWPIWKFKIIYLIFI